MLIPAHQLLLEAQDSYQLEVVLEPVEPHIYRVQQIKRELAREQAPISSPKVVADEPSASRPPSLYRPRVSQNRPQRISTIPAEQPSQPF